MKKSTIFLLITATILGGAIGLLSYKVKQYDRQLERDLGMPKKSIADACRKAGLFYRDSNNISPKEISEMSIEESIN